MITTSIALIFGVAFLIFGLAAWVYLVKWMRSKEKLYKQYAESRIVIYGKLAMLALPLYFLTELIRDVYFMSDPNLRDIRVSLFGFVMTGVMFVGILIRIKIKSRNVPEDF